MNKTEIAKAVTELVEEVYADRDIDTTDHIIKFGSCPEDLDFEDKLNTKLEELFPNNPHYIEVDTFHPLTIEELVTYIDERYN